MKSIYLNKAILSIQSHVVYGYVGNKAAVYPLQSMGFDVWPMYTVQFSNHTGYGQWTGEIFSAKHILELFEGLAARNELQRCAALLTGYMGSAEICAAIREILGRLRAVNPSLVYLCDPVLGGQNTCYVDPAVASFFKETCQADIITPNQTEATFLTGIEITDLSSVQAVLQALHQRGNKQVIITGVQLQTQDKAKLASIFSDGKQQYMALTPNYQLGARVNGTGDLFSALYLGAFLRHPGQPELAFKEAVYLMDKVVQATAESGSSELAVLAVDYRNALDSLMIDPQHLDFRPLFSS